MAGLSSDTIIKRRSGDSVELPVAAKANIYGGAIVAVNATGFAVPASEAVDLKAVGCAKQQALNALGADGDMTVQVEKGIFCFANSSAADAITLTNLSDICYMVDDQTVALTSNENKRSKAGTVFDVDENGVWVRMN